MDSRFALALKYHETGLADEAWAMLSDHLAEPDVSLGALRLGAVLRFEAGKFDEAAVLVGRMLQQKPGDAEIWNMSGMALQRSGALQESEAAYRRAVALRDNFAEAWNNLGNVLADQSDVKGARDAYQRVLDHDSGHALAHNNLGTLLAGEGYYAAAGAAYRRALDCAPNNAGARANFGVALLEQGRAAESLAQFDAILAADPANRNAADNRLYAMHYVIENPVALYEAHAAWGRTQNAVSAVPRRDGNPSRRLKVGYISPDFRQHSVSYFIEPLLAAHDLAVVDVFAYADVPQPDAVTARLKTLVPQWRDIAGVSDDAVRRLIAQDDIDILVDLAGHTVGNRLGVFVPRAAPVQITALGYPGTTGLPSMDARLCDTMTDPPAADAWATEKLIRLPGLHCYGPPADAPPVSPLPSGPFTFGSFNKLAKISDATVMLWSAVLKAVPTARLIIKSKPLAEPVTRAATMARFAAQGIAPERLDLLGWVDDAAGHLGLYNKIHVALDTVPYNGTTTTCEALWMGVPVLTMAGTGHAARVGASLLTSAGRPEWITENAGAFVAIAVKISNNINELNEDRQSLRAQMKTARLCGARGYADAVEAAYRALWTGTRGTQ